MKETTQEVLLNQIKAFEAVIEQIDKRRFEFTDEKYNEIHGKTIAQINLFKTAIKVLDSNPLTAITPLA